MLECVKVTEGEVRVEVVSESRQHLAFGKPPITLKVIESAGSDKRRLKVHLQSQASTSKVQAPYVSKFGGGKWSENDWH